MAGHFLQSFYPGSPNPLKSEKPFSKNELPTAVIQVVGNGVTFSCRALFGTGAQANLTTKTCAKKLNF